MRSTYLRIRQVSDPDVPDSPSGTPDSYAQELVVVPKKRKWYQKNVSTKYPGKLKLQPLNTSVPSPHKPSIRIMYRVQGEYATGNIPQSPKTWTRLFGEEHVRQTDPQSGKQILKPEFREILLSK